ncbi:RagB/SusD family nutrient uptake outer membrane protein [Niabella sp. W65]|nr:RagB/SusD family nutrient uptake outer membrane protein [Niabella sp. W65]MCH7363227.1 RagB/SusD family nutrient uptake outer membrane protein [Niabella sp. W65]ULT39155.1 RagB/SusD family nutrient uptake outer membrane protein [Niabella sp. I65]
MQKRQYKAEARALRAIYYFYLFRIYGPVVLLGNDVMPVDAPFQELQLPRNSVDECIEYIASELDAAAADLPIRPLNDANIARITKPIALGIKATALLYAASPLFNGNTDFASLKNKDGKQLIPKPMMLLNGQKQLLPIKISSPSLCPAFSIYIRLINPMEA